jgi:hypothetical protein
MGNGSSSTLSGDIMTKFTKENLIKSGPYIHYRPEGGSYSDQKFVARFKRIAGAGSFMTCLRKNFTVEEYFARIDAGEAPLPIAESKGYLLPHIKKEMKRGGYPLTKTGHSAWWADELIKIDAYMAKRSA